MLTRRARGSGTEGTQALVIRIFVALDRGSRRPQEELDLGALPLEEVFDYQRLTLSPTTIAWSVAVVSCYGTWDFEAERKMPVVISRFTDHWLQNLEVFRMPGVATCKQGLMRVPWLC